MIFRPATTDDIPKILKLQEKYLVTNIEEQNKHQGFVTTPFTVEQINYVIGENCLFVADDNGTIAAYVFVGSWQFFSNWKIFELMTQKLPELSFKNQQLSAINSFQYGPVCIDEAYRGQNVLIDLFELMRNHLKKRYPWGVTFINKLNKRSFNAHTNKLGLKVIDEFEFNNNQYYTLAFDMNVSVL